MDHGFGSEEWKSLPPKERARQCRILADEARILAGSASKEMKPIYLDLAVQWEKLAAEMMREP